VDALIAFAGALALASTPPQATTTVPWQPMIEEASRRFGVPRAWIERVMQAESGGRTRLDGAPIRSRAGAIGLMQLMPRTWADMRSALGLGSDPDDPHDNILAGTFYLRQMYDRFGYPGLFAAYNAGPARYATALATDAPLPAETRAYLTEVAAPPTIVERRATLFAIAPQADLQTTSPPARRPSLFVPLADPPADRP
jgi:soluble lytic murein transglycosylase-like protein